jgi:hypothetical protein
LAVLPDQQLLGLGLELECLPAALEGAMLLAGAILDRFATLFALLNYLELEATAFTNVDLVQLHVVAACHFLTSNLDSITRY